MKIKNIISIILLVLVLGSCKDELTKDLDFGVKVIPSSKVTLADSIVKAVKGTSVEFEFTGEPDFISFSYERFILTNATLKFSTLVAWGTHFENTLGVYLSESFPGLLLTDFTKDAEAVKNHAWKELSAVSNLPKATNITQNASISLNEYRGKNVVIAFQYKPSFVADWQPKWIVSNLIIDNTMTTDNSPVSTYLASTMGFSPFDLLDQANAYKSLSDAGKWNITNTAAMEIKNTAPNNPLNQDWLISKPILVPMGVTEQSGDKAIKNISNRLNSYTYKFDKVGRYVVTFKAANKNYKYESSAEKKIIIEVSN